MEIVNIPTRIHKPWLEIKASVYLQTSQCIWQCNYNNSKGVTLNFGMFLVGKCN